MKSDCLPPSSCRGSITVVALVICAIGTIGLLGAVSLVQARVLQVEAVDQECMRRIRTLNGQQLAKQYAYQFMGATTSASPDVVEIGQWARIDVAGWTETPFTTTTSDVAFNHTTPGGAILPFTVTSAIEVRSHLDAAGAWNTAMTPVTRTVKVQSLNSALAGYLLDLRRGSVATPSRITGNLTVNGKAFVSQWSAEAGSYQFLADSVQSHNDSVLDADFNVTTAGGRPDNLPFLPLPENDGANVATDYEGDRHVVMAEYMVGGTAAQGLFPTALAAGATIFDAGLAQAGAGVSSDGAGNVTVDLNNLNLVHTVLSGPIFNLTFTGQNNAAEAFAVENLAPVFILYAGDELTTVQFRDSNARPLILGFQRIAAPVNEAVHLQPQLLFDSGEAYRMFLFMENAGGAFISAGAVQLEGGLFLDYWNTFSGGTFALVEDRNPYLFIDLLPRHFWFESYQNL